MTWFFVAMGGALGASARYWLYNAHPVLQQKLGLATVVVNVAGSFLMGLVFMVVTERAGLSPTLRPLVGVGFLGAFTTYSTYSLDAWRLLEQGQPVWAVSYLLGTLVLCIAATGAGLMVGRALSG